MSDNPNRFSIFEIRGIQKKLKYIPLNSSEYISQHKQLSDLCEIFPSGIKIKVIQNTCKYCNSKDSFIKDNCKNCGAPRQL
jgi:hypothetical protein